MIACTLAYALVLGWELWLKPTLDGRAAAEREWAKRRHANDAAEHIKRSDG